MPSRNLWIEWGSVVANSSSLQFGKAGFGGTGDGFLVDDLAFSAHRNAGRSLPGGIECSDLFDGAIGAIGSVGQLPFELAVAG